MPGAQAVRALVDHSLIHKQQISADLQQRLLCWVFGMTVIGQLWLWPIYVFIATQSLLFAVLLLTYMGWILLGPGKDAVAKEGPYYAPWRHLHIWQRMADYLQARLVKTAELDPEQRYVFAAYPHGISAISGWLSFATEATGFTSLFPGIRPYCMTLASNFKCPGIREYCLSYGLRSCERRACVNMLKQKPGVAVVIFPGGAAEALVTEQFKYKLILNRRKGFARIAVETGASLVPVFAFGETDLFETFLAKPGSWTAKMQQISHRYWGTSQPLFRGNGIFTDSGLLPLPRPITTVIGAPIPVQKVDPRNAGQEAFSAAVDALHAQYCDALQQLFDAHKDKYAPNRQSELQIVG
jgi:1-acyl-sn-glycerol-3-phosphate acyltransferase